MSLIGDLLWMMFVACLLAAWGLLKLAGKLLAVIDRAATREWPIGWLRFKAITILGGVIAVIIAAVAG